MTDSNELSLFFAYAREDSSLRNRLDKHLASLKRNKQIKTWHDGKIDAGKEWEDNIFQALENADIILLLISADFIDSDYCYNIEMEKSIQRHKDGQAVVIPIVLTHCDWTDTPFAKLQALPKDAIPIMDKRWDNEDKALSNVATGVKSVVIRMLKEREGHISDYFTEITKLKEEKNRLEAELKFAKEQHRILEQKNKSNNVSKLQKELEEKESIITSQEEIIKKLKQSLNKYEEDKHTVKLRKNDNVKIINEGYVYSTINELDNIKWTDPEMKTKAGLKEWEKTGFIPKSGMSGTVVYSFIHPWNGKNILVLLVDGSHYVPIGEEGIEFLRK